MTTSANRGKAFEYTTIMTALNYYNATPFSQVTESFISTNGALAFNTLSVRNQQEMYDASLKLIEKLSEIEPWLLVDRIQVEYFPTVGGTPDVVDMYLHSDTKSVGVSLKSNHNAARHSRVSPRIDVAVNWLGVQTDEIYMNNIRNNFENFLSYCNANNINLYRELTINQKNELLYSPITNTFLQLLQRNIVHGAQREYAIGNMITYLVGNTDFYKGIANFRSRELTLEAYDLRGTLSVGQQLIFPTQCLDISRPLSSNGLYNHVDITFNNDWEVRMRIHNASSRIERSLKWDVKLSKLPSNIWTNIYSF